MLESLKHFDTLPAKIKVAIDIIILSEVSRDIRTLEAVRILDQMPQVNVSNLRESKASAMIEKGLVFGCENEPSFQAKLGILTDEALRFRSEIEACRSSPAKEVYMKIFRELSYLPDPRMKPWLEKVKQSQDRNTAIRS